MGRILYIVYLWLFFVPVFLVLTILTAVTVIIGCLLGGEKIFAYYPGMIWSRLTCYLALCPVTVKGREHIDRKQSYVFVANHQGAFDIFLIYGFLGVPIKWVMKAGIAKIPFVGTACRAAVLSLSIILRRRLPLVVFWRRSVSSERGFRGCFPGRFCVRIRENDPFQERGLSNGARSAFAYYSDHLKRAV